MGASRAVTGENVEDRLSLVLLKLFYTPSLFHSLVIPRYRAFVNRDATDRGCCRTRISHYERVARTRLMTTITEWAFNVKGIIIHYDYDYDWRVDVSLTLLADFHQIEIIINVF